MSVRNWAAATALVALQAACSGGGLQKEWAIEDGAWQVADSLVEDFTATEAMPLQQIKLGLTLTDKYPYRNLYIKCRIRTPGGREYTTMPEFLFTDEAGNWLSKRSWQGSYDFEVVVNPGAEFKQPGVYQFCLVQYMRQDTLPGVQAVRFSVQDILATQAGRPTTPAALQ